MIQLTKHEYKFETMKHLDKFLKQADSIYFVDNETVIYKFSAYKYKKHTVLYCKLLIDTNENTIKLYVLDENNRPYAPFYTMCGNYKPLILKVNRRIRAELKRYHIVRRKAIDNE